MATLTDRTLTSTYKGLLFVDNSGNGVDGTLRVVEDGEGTDSALQLSSTAMRVAGDLTVTGTTTLNGIAGAAFMTGADSSTDNAVVRFGGTGGATIQNSAVIIDDSNVVTGITSLTVDNLNANGNSVISTDTNGAINLTPNGSGAVAVSSDLTMVDNKYLIAGSNSDIKIGYDEAGIDALQIGANIEGAALKLHLYADQSDDNADNWLATVADGGVITLGSKISGSYVTHLTVTPHATVASSTIAAAGHLTVAGNLTVSGTTTTVNSTTLQVKDPIIALGTADDGGAPGSDDNKDRGLLLHYHTGSAAKTAFIGWDDNDGKFTMIPDATISSEVVSGTVGTLKLTGVDFADGTSQTTAAADTSGNHNLAALVALGVF